MIAENEMRKHCRRNDYSQYMCDMLKGHPCACVLCVQCVLCVCCVYVLCTNAFNGDLISAFSSKCPVLAGSYQDSLCTPAY